MANCTLTEMYTDLEERLFGTEGREERWEEDLREIREGRG